MTKRTAFFHDEKCLWHSTQGLFSLILPVGTWVQPPAGAGLAESPESKRRAISLLQVSGLVDEIEFKSAPSATEEDLLRIHPDSYLEKFADLSKRQKQLEMKKQIALEEARMEAELAEIKAGSKANVQGIESKSDVDELQGMLSVKEQMAQQKMARKAQEQQHELEMARIKADVDKSVGVAQAEAKAQVLKRKFESEDSKKNEKNRS